MVRGVTYVMNSPTEHHVEVIRVGQVTPHPNADRLETTMVGGYPVCFAKGEYKPGDLAVYVPVDSVVPDNDTRWSFLDGHTRIKAKRLRGVFSMGLLTKPEPTWVLGQEVGTDLRITKYEPFVENPEQNESDPGIAPVYGVEGWRRWANRQVFGPEEQVVVMEKLHGENARFTWHQNRMWCGSHGKWKPDTLTSQWWGAARLYSVPEKLGILNSSVVLYGEILGHVPDMNYGHNQKARGLAFFDALDANTRTFLNWADFKSLMTRLQLPTAPVLYEGPFKGFDSGECEGLTTYPQAFGKHIREGFVIKPQTERYDNEIGRVALKLHGSAYLLRKNG